ncbi:MAG: SRPBCC family protein [Sporichthyaceae bacterium]
MGEKQRVSGSTQIAASPETVYAMVTDLPRMGEWSPEAAGGTWVKGATGAAPGAKFKGKNRNGNKKWSSVVEVVEASAPTRFAFRTAVGPLSFAQWIYEITPGGDGCMVTETWVDTRPGLVVPLGKLVTGVGDRAAFTRTSIETTLANLKKAAESSA